MSEKLVISLEYVNYFMFKRNVDAFYYIGCIFIYIYYLFISTVHIDCHVLHEL